MAVSFFYLSKYKPFRKTAPVKKWIEKTATTEKKSIGTINIIFCSDEYLLQINRQSLNHDYYTDIITFDYSSPKKISGDLYISTDRVRDNARSLIVPVQQEFQRVVIHGVLHLIGYKDGNEQQQKIMRKKEDEYLEKFTPHFKIEKIKINK